MEPGIINVQSWRDLRSIMLFEFIGTTIMLMGINLSGGSPVVVVACIFTAAIMTYRVSGAHFNAALSVAIYIVEGKWKKNLPILGASVAGSLLGALAGTLLAYFIQGKEGMAILKPKDGASIGYVATVELLSTLILMLIIL